MNVGLLLVLAVLFRIGFDVSVSRTGGKIDDWLANGLLAAIEAAGALLVFVLIRNNRTLPTTKNGVFFSLLAGVSVLLFTVLLIKIYAQGDNLSYVTPVVYGGTLIGSSLVGWTLLKQPFSLMGSAGIVVIAIGISLVAFSKQ